MLLENFESAGKYAVTLICRGKDKVRAQVWALENPVPGAGKQKTFTVSFALEETFSRPLASAGPPWV